MEHTSTRVSSKAWEFIGKLVRISKNDEGVEIQTPYRPDTVFCKLCFDEQMKCENGLLSRVYNVRQTTSSGNFLNHAANKHGKHFTSRVSEAKITDWLQKTCECTPADSQYEFNRDLTLMLCKDLEPFTKVENAGFVAFCKKNCNFDMPDSATVATTALVDVYQNVKEKVLNILSNCYGATLMMDGWTDRYHRRPYFAIRTSVIHEWAFRVITLAIKPVESHTSASLSYFVKEIVSEFFPHHKQMVIFDTTDGASNMLLLSKLLNHERTTCVAHSIHLLLTVDSFAKIPEVEELLKKCKEIVQALHFKGHLIEHEQMLAKEAELYEKMKMINEMLMLDEDNAIHSEDTEEESDKPQQAKHQDSKHVHMTLKTSVPVRWNSVLSMLESILDMQKYVSEVLKKVGKADLCLNVDDIELLEQLRAFLTPFKEFTLLVSECSPNLSLVPLIRSKIQSLCQVQAANPVANVAADCASIKKMKILVTKNLDKRLPMTHLTKVSVCFDPAVRDAVLSRDECFQLILNAFHELSKFNEDLFKSVISQQVEDSELPCHSQSQTVASAAKRLRLSILSSQNQSLNTEAGNTKTGSMTIEDEISSYLAMHEHGDETALEFWKRNCKQLPHLSIIARIYLAISPGSVPVESLFSISGLVLNSRRSLLAPYRLNMICFIHDNASFL